MAVDMLSKDCRCLLFTVTADVMHFTDVLLLLLLLFAVFGFQPAHVIFCAVLAHALLAVSP